MLKEDWRQRADLDLQSITIFLAVGCENLKAAESASERIFSVVDMLREFPDTGGMTDDDMLKRAYRTMPADPYMIYYTYTDEVLTIHRILHQRQDIDTYALVDF